MNLIIKFADSLLVAAWQLMKITLGFVMVLASSIIIAYVIYGSWLVIEMNKIWQQMLISTPVN